MQALQKVLPMGYGFVISQKPRTVIPLLNTKGTGGVIHTFVAVITGVV